MLAQGADRQTRSQAMALSFLTPGELESQPFSTPATSQAQGIIDDFYLAEERRAEEGRAEREERRIEREEQLRQKDRQEDKQ